MKSGNTKIDSGDLEDAYENIAEHGYTIEAGTQIVCLMNRAELKEVRKFRMGVVNNNPLRQITISFRLARSLPNSLTCQWVCLVLCRLTPGMVCGFMVLTPIFFG